VFPTYSNGRNHMTTRGRGGFGGIIVAIVWSLVLGIIIALIGLIAFGGFARGRWY